MTGNLYSTERAFYLRPRRAAESHLVKSERTFVGDPITMPTSNDCFSMNARAARTAYDIVVTDHPRMCELPTWCAAEGRRVARMATAKRSRRRSDQRSETASSASWTFGRDISGSGFGRRPTASESYRHVAARCTGFLVNPPDLRSFAISQPASAAERRLTERWVSGALARDGTCRRSSSSSNSGISCALFSHCNTPSGPRCSRRTSRVPIRRIDDNVWRSFWTRP